MEGDKNSRSARPKQPVSSAPKRQKLRNGSRALSKKADADSRPRRREAKQYLPRKKLTHLGGQRRKAKPPKSSSIIKSLCRSLKREYAFKREEMSVSLRSKRN